VSEATYSKKIKADLRAKGWTIINLEAVGNGVPDCLCAKKRKVFLLEFKYAGNALNKRQINFKKKNILNIEICYLTKIKNQFNIRAETSFCIFKSRTEVIKFFENEVK
jgi:hypothetical protein